MERKNTLIALTAGVVEAYLGNHNVAISDLPILIKGVHEALAGADAAPEEPIAATVVKVTSAQIRKSITQDALISFLDGKPYKTLRRHLTTHGLTVEQYKTQFGLPVHYPTTAPAYSEARSAMAKRLGLGQGGRKAKGAKANSRKA